MSIDARVDTVIMHTEAESGELRLIDRPPDGCKGQSRLYFNTAPHEVTALNGLDVWGGDGQLMLGDRMIAERHGYKTIVFVPRPKFLEAVKEYHERRRENRIMAAINEVIGIPVTEAGVKLAEEAIEKGKIKL